MGFAEALSWMRGLGFYSVIFYAKSVVDVVYSSKSDFSDFGSIIECCRRVLAEFPLHFQFVLLIDKQTRLLMCFGKRVPFSC
ncbi:hypothetical protein PTKIN_Ptkin10aG0173000 [Pterospermum kingtungense]